MSFKNRLSKLEKVTKIKYTTEVREVSEEELKNNILNDMDMNYEFIKYAIDEIEGGREVNVDEYRDYHYEKYGNDAEIIKLNNKIRKIYLENIKSEKDREFIKEMLNEFENNHRFRLHEWSRTYLRFSRKIPSERFNGRMVLTPEIKKDIRAMQVEAGIEEKYLLEV